MRELPFELYRAAQVRELDRIAIEDRGIPGYTLMNRAGEAAFNLLGQHWPNARRIAVVCGGGNNGGDGYVVARLAHQAGLQVRVLTLADPEQLSGDAQTAWQDALAAGTPITPFSTVGLDDTELLVDAILGTGLEREVSGAWRDAIQAMNADLVIGDLADPDSLRLLNSASVVHLGATSKGARNERKYT